MTRLSKWLSIAIVFVIVSISAIIFFAPIPPLLNGIHFSTAVYDKHHQLLRLTLSKDAKFRVFTALSDISPIMREATLLEEDRYFELHMGLNPWSLIKAAWQTYGLKSRRIGGSTITMQVARLRFGIHSKSLTGKLWQMVRALQIEMHYSKQQILEAYLNLAPYGNNVEGIGAASLIYFAKTAKELTLPEALTLAVIPQNPNKRTLKQTILQESRQKIFQSWLLFHPDDANKKPLFDLPLQMRDIRKTPFLAPHFVNQVLANARDNSYQIITTLDLNLQKMIERVTRRYVERKKILGVNNAVVLLIDYQTMETKALLGSSNFFNQTIAGQVNGTLMKRSPGSTLKPFIYGLAIDQGLIHPATVLKDVPRSFGSYNPENFDNDFAGPIKAKDALVLSRNIPAIYLAEQLKHPSLYEFLLQANIANLKSESFYGLSLVLGGAELSMQELVSLYATLANDGRFQSLHTINNEESDAGKQLFSREASFLILDMLTDNENSFPDSPVAYKTGTSSGYRDAWTVGVFGSYVLAVWVGNFNNQGNPTFVGKEIAAPLFFEIYHALHAQLGLLPIAQKNLHELNLKKIDVCKASGMLPTKYCHDTEKSWFIPGKSPIKTDTIHREVAIDSKTGLRVCHFDKNTRFEIYEFWSSDLLKLFKLAGLERRVPPPYDSKCTINSKTNNGVSPQIISPQTQVYYIARLPNQTANIPLTATSDADVQTLYWFANANFLGKSSRDKPYIWNTKSGNFIIRVLDDFGRSDARKVIVMADK